MKYIRTKDNIYEIINDYSSSCAIKSRGKRGKTAIDGFTIKYGLSYAPRADTIEELCDAFALETEGKITTYDKAYFTCFSEDWYHDYLKAFDFGGMLGHEMSVNGYGAIHIKDKGLIYVAKMNNEGELELL